MLYRLAPLSVSSYSSFCCCCLLGVEPTAAVPGPAARRATFDDGVAPSTGLLLPLPLLLLTALLTVAAALPLRDGISVLRLEPASGIGAGESFARGCCSTRASSIEASPLAPAVAAADGGSGDSRVARSAGVAFSSAGLTSRGSGDTPSTTFILLAVVAKIDRATEWMAPKRLWKSEHCVPECHTAPISEHTHTRVSSKSVSLPYVHHLFCRSVVLPKSASYE